MFCMSMDGIEHCPEPPSRLNVKGNQLLTWKSRLTYTNKINHPSRSSNIQTPMRPLNCNPNFSRSQLQQPVLHAGLTQDCSVPFVKVQDLAEILVSARELRSVGAFH